MPSRLTSLQVFLATPSGLDAERKCSRETACDLNSKYALDKKFHIRVCGFETIPSGVGRPQELINNSIRTSDYLILILEDRWGSPTSHNTEYTAGVQEELHVGVECLSDPEAPMQDIAILFKGANERQLSDPGPQLKSVLEFKRELEDTRQLYYKTFDSDTELRRELETLFRNWINNFGPKLPKTLELPSLSRLSDPKESSSEPDNDTTTPLSEALEYAAEGNITQAELAFASAIASNDQGSLIEYAKFLRRAGRLDHALEINERLLHLLDAQSTDSSVSVMQCNILANMGIICRKLGRLRKSESYLVDALKPVTDATTEDAIRSRAYALDNLGHTRVKLGMENDALEHFSNAHELRKGISDRVGEAKSLINLARHMSISEPASKLHDMTAAAIAILEDAEHESRSLATAHSLMGRILMMSDDVTNAQAHYETALKLNETMDNMTGVAIVSGQLARLMLSMNNRAMADTYSRRCLSENKKSGNEEGVAVAWEIRGQVRLAEEDYSRAGDCFRTAFTIFHRHEDIAGALSAKISEAFALHYQGEDQLAIEAATVANSLKPADEMVERELRELSRLFNILGMN